MSFINKINFLNESLRIVYSEAVYGNKASVYHRTRTEDLINHVYTSGFKPGNGDAYGKGFYSTYDLESQLGPQMKESYGELIIRFMINSIKNFLVLDYDEFIKSPAHDKLKDKDLNKNNFVKKQLDYFGFNKIHNYDDINFEAKKTSDIAMAIYRKYQSIIEELIDGMIFTGEFDGKVLLSYNTDIIIPTSYSIDEGKNFNKIKNVNKDYLKKVFNASNISKKNIKDIHFIKKANIEHYSQYEIVDDKKTNSSFIWNYGTWNYGTWEYGTWKSGSWLNGAWQDGVWEKGNFENGVWKKGIWLDGSFEKKAIWENGTWKKGNWNGGTWISGEWLGGRWWGGYDKNENWHDRDDSPDKW